MLSHTEALKNTNKGGDWMDLIFKPRQKLWQAGCYQCWPSREVQSVLKEQQYPIQILP